MCVCETERESIFGCIPVVCLYARLRREQLLPSRVFPCRRVGIWVPGRAARQLHRLGPSVGRQPCLHTPCLSANLYRVDFTDRVIGALEG